MDWINPCFDGSQHNEALIQSVSFTRTTRPKFNCNKMLDPRVWQTIRIQKWYKFHSNWHPTEYVLCNGNIRSNRRTIYHCTSAADENYKIQALQPAFAPGRGITNASSDALPFTQTNGGAAKIKTENKNKNKKVRARYHPRNGNDANTYPLNKNQQGTKQQQWCYKNADLNSTMEACMVIQWTDRIYNESGYNHNTILWKRMMQQMPCQGSTSTCMNESFPFATAMLQYNGRYWTATAAVDRQW